METEEAEFTAAFAARHLYFMISLISSSVCTIFCSLFFMFLSTSFPCFASSGPISTEYWNSLRSASDRALGIGRRMSSISVGTPVSLKVEVIVWACVSMSLFSGIMITCFFAD